MKESTPVIIVDTREQRLLCFGASVETRRACLPVGDYSCEGHELEWAIERKSLDDYVQSITHQRDRFFRELEKLAKYDFARIVVCDSIEAIANHHYTSMAHPNSVLGTSYAIEVDLGIPIWWAGDEEHGAIYVQGALSRLWRESERARLLDDVGEAVRYHAGE
jgi:DNA excision repair protein ERCC-4